MACPNASKFAVSAAVCALWIGGVRLAHAQTYTVSDLSGLPGSTSTQANGINAAGQVVGYSVVGSTEYATEWSNGTVINLGGLPGSVQSYATAINSAGTVVGVSYVGGIQYATEWKNGVVTNLGASSGNTNSVALGINSAGAAVGFSYVSVGNESASLWSGGTVTNLGPSQAFAINDSEQIVGDNYTSSSDATLWSGGSITDLGTLGGIDSVAVGINSAGQAVGGSFTTGDTGYDATLWTSGSITDLGGLPGSTYSGATGINDAGQIVGTSEIFPYPGAQQGISHAVLWSGGLIADLNTELNSSGLGWFLYGATGINNDGQIIGEGDNPLGQYDAFVLTPVPTAVPELSTWAMLLVGFVGVGFIGYRRTMNRRPAGTAV